MLQEIKSATLPEQNDSDVNPVNIEKDNWVEAVAFCTDPELPLAVTGTINGEIYIWDITKKVSFEYTIKLNIEPIK